MSEKFFSEKAPSPVGLYPHARKAGQFLFLSGIGPRNAKDNSIPGNVYDERGQLTSYDFVAQCHSVFQNVKTVLESCGSNWNQLIDVTVFLTNMQHDFKMYNQLYADYFRENQPCRTTIEIKSLPTAIAIELKCIAWMGD
jgi:2-aminomuconate deaminase